MALLTPPVQTFSIPTYETKFYCFEPPGLLHFLWQPKEMNTEREVLQILTKTKSLVVLLEEREAFHLCVSLGARAVTQLRGTSF